VTVPAVPGTGFHPDDPVETLTLGPTMDSLKAPDGRWLMVPAPFDPGRDIAPELPITVVVVDTGVCDDHPTLMGQVLEQVDLTGEGVRDENGHGTAVAASLVASAGPGAKIISVKALNREGKASVSLLSHAIRVASDFKADRLQLNVSAGRRNPSCTGDCPLCLAVKYANRDGSITICAAGNTPGVTYCPGKSAIAVATPDSWSAPGDIVLRPRDWVEIP
jgi:hypothetical protein